MRRRGGEVSGRKGKREIAGCCIYSACVVFVFRKIGVCSD